MRFAYADPPYPGKAGIYADHPDFGGEVNHHELLDVLCSRYPDGWALSTSAEGLRMVLPACPEGVRVCCWVRKPRITKTRRATSMWEPVLVYGGRVQLEPVVQDLGDVLLWGGRQHSHPGALAGMKPAAFCEWVFRLLGARQGDQLDDLFPGSGAIGRAWQLYVSPVDGERVPSRFAGAQEHLDAVLEASATSRGWRTLVPGPRP